MKAKKIRLYYGIFLSVFTAALGAAFIAVAIGILRDGNWVQGAYSRDIVAERLFPVSIVFYIWIAAIIAGFVLSLVYPYQDKAVKIPQERATVKRLSARIPEGSGEEYDKNLKLVRDENRNRLIVYCVCAAICFAGAIASAVYLLQPNNFASHDKNASMLNMLINVGPWVLVAFAASVAMVVFEKFSYNREIAALKQLIANYKGNPVIAAEKPQNAVWLKIKAFFGNKYFKLGVRIAVGVVALTFILVGVFDTEGARDVFIKAVNICTECIGLG
ncbi:MAG: hypothetical protein K2K38_06305 [Clostridia bacterium]|nr:hypothetical protein [Clostridia bacterium]